VRPLLHFVALGGLLFAARSLWLAPQDPIAITGADVQRLRAEWAQETRRAPTARELDAQIRHLADEEMLVREALRLGLDRSDPVVASRLVRNMRFIGAAGDEAALLAQAVAIGMAHRDVVARRRLVQAMHERFAAGIALDDADVRRYVERHADRYSRAPRVSFRQRYLGAGGQPVLLARELVEVTPEAVARSFGGAFADALLQAPVGQWTGPVQSAYGPHEVYVVAREPAQPAEFEVVQRQARYALREEREREAVARATQALRRHYPLSVEAQS
jgi:peptidyl-prolyl cis-trans isomerase C